MKTEAEEIKNIVSLLKLAGQVVTTTIYFFLLTKSGLKF